MKILLNIALLLLVLIFGFYSLTKNDKKKRVEFFKYFKDTPKKFFGNCKIVVSKLKNKKM